MIGTSRNPNLVAPAGTKNKLGGGPSKGGLLTSSIGASIDDINSA